MKNLFKVICKSGNMYLNKNFNSYDTALDFASNQTYSGFNCLILQLDLSTLKWKRGLSLYPSETC